MNDQLSQLNYERPSMYNTLVHSTLIKIKKGWQLSMKDPVCTVHQYIV